jgi:hypothetical protein
LVVIGKVNKKKNPEDDECVRKQLYHARILLLSLSPHQLRRKLNNDLHGPNG